MTLARSLIAFVLLAVACGTGEARLAPSGPDVVPELAFGGVDENGVTRVIQTNDYFEPDGDGHVLVVRVEGGEWCGTCAWHAAHTSELFALPHGDRVRVRAERIDPMRRRVEFSLVTPS